MDKNDNKQVQNHDREQNMQMPYLLAANAFRLPFTSNLQILIISCLPQQHIKLYMFVINLHTITRPPKKMNARSSNFYTKTESLNRVDHPILYIIHGGL